MSKNNSRAGEQQQNKGLASDLPSRARPVNEQAHSKLMQLPQEIRDEIYATLFTSTRFSYGRRAFGQIKSRSIVSANRGVSLAILRTCRRIQAEVESSWLGQVLFSFEEPEALLNTVADLPAAIRSHIRHIRVSGHPLMLSFPDEDDDVYYRTVQVLELLPGLKLDELTVVGGKGAQVCYDTLNGLIKYGNGWKQLRFISHNSELLAYKDNMLYFGANDPLLESYLRQPQPSSWQEALEQRDGKTTKPSVRIGRSNLRTTPCSILRQSTLKPLNQTFSAGQDSRSYGKVEDESLMRAGQREQEVVVFVKRGEGVDYSVKEDSAYLPIGDIRQDFDLKTWKEIKAVQDAIDQQYRDSDEDEPPEQTERRHAIEDKYIHVDDIDWPPLHFLKD